MIGECFEIEIIRKFDCDCYCSGDTVRDRLAHQMNTNVHMPRSHLTDHWFMFAYCFYFVIISIFFFSFFSASKFFFFALHTAATECEWETHTDRLSNACERTQSCVSAVEMNGRWRARTPDRFESVRANKLQTPVWIYIFISVLNGTTTGAYFLGVKLTKSPSRAWYKNARISITTGFCFGDNDIL